MPDREPAGGHSARLLRGLVWAGVLLAPLAAAVVLLGHSSGSVRFAVLLLAVSVVLVGASVLIRSDPVLHRMDVEDRVAEEVEALRAELRSGLRGGPAPTRDPDESDFFRSPPTATPPPARIPAQRAPERAVAAARPEPGMSTGGRAPGMSTGGRAPGMSTGGRAPGMSTGGRPMREPGLGTGGRAVASAAAVVPPPPPPAPPPAGPRASASVRPGTQYGRPESLDGDFGASNGYAGAMDAPAAGPAGVYGRPAAADDYAPADDYRGGYGPEQAYGPGPGLGHGPGYQQGYGEVYEQGYDDGYGPAGDGYGQQGGEADDYGQQGGEADGYGAADGYEAEPGHSTGDPHYRARRHRPSANDTNVGTLADFAAFGGYDGYGEPPADERYVQGFGADPHGGRW
jgi:hypothetical protein